MHGGDDPVDPSIAADGFVLRINEDDLEELVTRVLSNPVRIEHPEGTHLPGNPLFSDRSERPLKLELVYTDACRLTVANTFRNRPLPATTLHTNAVDNVALLGLVPEAPRLVWAGRARRTVNRRELTILPGANAKQESKQIALLSLVNLFEVLVSAHLDEVSGSQVGSWRTERREEGEKDR